MASLVNQCAHTCVCTVQTAPPPAFPRGAAHHKPGVSAGTPQGLALGWNLFCATFLSSPKISTSCVSNSAGERQVLQSSLERLVDVITERNCLK